MNGLAILAVAAAAPLAATIVDRVAIAAGNQVITDSEIDLRIRLTAFENGERPVFDAASRKAAADRLIDQKLVEHEMDVGHYPRTAGAGAGAPLAGYANPQALDDALARYSLTRQDLEQDLTRQADLLTFLSVRFRPAVDVSDRDVREYFDHNIKPKLKDPAAGLEDFRAQIETEVANERADRDMEAWLKDQRRRTRIVYLEQDLAP
jgi:hypothetical protein